MIIVGETLLRIAMSTNSLVTVSLRDFKHHNDKDSKLPSKKTQAYHVKTIKELIEKLHSRELHLDPDISMLVDFTGVYLASLMLHRESLYVCEVIHMYLTMLINTIQCIMDKGKVSTTSVDIETAVNALNELHAEAYYLRARVYYHILKWTQGEGKDYLPIVTDFFCALKLGSRAAEDDFEKLSAQRKSLRDQYSITAVSFLRMPDKNMLLNREQKFIELKTLKV